MKVIANLYTLYTQESLVTEGSENEEDHRRSRTAARRGRSPQARPPRAAVMRARPPDAPLKAIQGRARIQRPLLDELLRTCVLRLLRCSESSVTSYSGMSAWQSFS